MTASRKKTPLSGDERWMGEALRRARLAARRGEVPVGCVIVRDGKLLGSGANRREGAPDPTAHAEIMALRRAAKAADDWRLDGAVCYVTLEPCLMCMGALKNARVGRLVFGARDPKQGASRLARKKRAATDGNDLPIEVTSGVRAEECAHLLKSFFAGRRKEKKGGG